MKKLFLLLVAVLSIGLCASAQTRTVRGTVLDATTDEPLIGASVTAGTSNMGVATDIDGAFSITVPADVTKLNVSYVGYEPQTVNITSNDLVVKLQPQANVLDDVIAVAYGTSKKSEYTGSAGVVKADQLENALVADVTSALAGKVAGVQTFSSNGQPGTAPSVRIRGTGSINAGSDPLYVVDGVPYTGDISNISTSDVEAMTVLKDAASTALYGARGANGVILITTKRGSEGKARVTVDARWGVNSRAIPNYDVIDDPRQFLELTYQTIHNTQMYFMGNKNEASINSYINNSIWSYFGGYQTYTIPEGQVAFDMNGRFNPNATEGYSNGRYYWKPDDWTKETLINGLRQEYNVSISGGTQRLQYYLSGTYLADEGIIKGSHFNRFSTLAKVDYQAKDWLKIGSSINYTYSNMSSPRDQDLDSDTSSGNAFYFANAMAPIYPMYVRNPDGSIMWNSQYNNPVYDYGDGDDYGNGMMNSGRSPQGNPVSGLLYDQNDYLVDVFDAKWYAQLTPIKGLSLTENVGYFLDNTRNRMLLNGVYGQFKELGGQAIQVAQRMRDITLQSLINYEFSIADRHNIALMAGYESEDFASEFVQASGTNLYQPLNPYVSNTIDNPNVGGQRSELSHRGFLFRGKYNFEDRYFFMASVRRDGSSRFAPGHRWGTFWSLSAGWDIAKESFMEEFTNVDLLKFRASFGQNGNDVIGSSTLYMPWADYYALSGSNGVFSDGVLAQKGNVDLTWETSNSFNIGFDFSFFKGMLSGSLEYYNRQTSDMLFNLPVAPSLGYSSIPSNVGSMRNNGFELDLNYRPVNTRDITWDIFANLTYGKNKILKLDPSILNEDGEWPRSTYVRLSEGESIYDLYLPQWAGVNPETGYAEYWAKRTVTDEDGNKTEEVYATTDWSEARTTNSKHTGDIAPKIYGGFGTTVNAYGFDFSISFAYQAGGKLIDYGYQNLMSVASVGAAHKDLLNAWTPENPNTDVPMLISQASQLYPNSMSDHLLTSSNYISLNNITLGYNFPSKWTKKIGIDGVRIYGAAENVALWSARKGLDPRQGFTASSNYTYSPIRAISGGIRVNF